MTRVMMMTTQSIISWRIWMSLTERTTGTTGPYASPFQDDELIVNGQDDDGHEEDEEREEAAPPLSALQFNVPQAIRFQEPLANMLTEAAYCEGGNGGSAAEESPPGSLAVPPPSSRYHPPWCCCHLCPAPSSRSTTPRNSSCGSNSNRRSSRRLPSDQVSPGPRLQQHLEGL
nr:uncharacterized protein LOC111950282 isoform X6 [Salvelinus alpinus]